MLVKQRKSENAVKEQVQLNGLRLIIEKLSPKPVWQYLFGIVVIWGAWAMLNDPTNSTQLPFSPSLLFWPAVIASSLSYFIASSKGLLAPALAFVLSCVMFAFGFKQAALIVLGYSYLGMVLEYFTFKSIGAH